MAIQRLIFSSLHDPGLCTLTDAIAKAKQLQEQDPRLPERLFALLTENRQLGPGQAERVLAIVGAITPCERLREMVKPLLGSAEGRIRSKAWKLFARCYQDVRWASQQLEAAEPRVGANIVEALWRAEPTEQLQWFFWRAAAHEDNRIAGNGIVGLFLLRHQRANETLQRLFRKKEPAALATAAWVAGRVADPVWINWLQPLAAHPDTKVRRNVATALRRIQAKNPTAA